MNWTQNKKKLMHSNKKYAKIRALFMKQLNKLKLQFDRRCIPMLFAILRLFIISRNIKIKNFSNYKFRRRK